MQKKKLRLFIIIPILSFQTFTIACQTPGTTTTSNEGKAWISIKRLQNGAALIKQGEINKELLVYYKQLVDTLNSRILLKQSIAIDLKYKDSLNLKIIDTYKAEVANLVEQRDMAVKQVANQNKLLRRQKRKTVFMAVAGPVVTAAAFIYLKK